MTDGREWSDFRGLHDRLLAYDGRDVLGDVLDPWLPAAAAELDELAAFAAQPLTPAGEAPPATADDLWRLYAASRASQVLLLRFQPWWPGETQYAGPDLSADQYAAFWGRLGFAAHWPAAFHPFDCEVVGVEPAAAPAAPAELADVLWPCVTRGPLLFERAGCVVYAGRDHVAPGVAGGRRCIGRTGGGFVYHADGRLDAGRPDAAEDGWPPADRTPAERVELLTHRCFVRAARPHGDLWSYDDTLRVEAGRQPAGLPRASRPGTTSAPPPDRCPVCGRAVPGKRVPQGSLPAMLPRIPARRAIARPRGHKTLRRPPGRGRVT